MFSQTFDSEAQSITKTHSNYLEKKKNKRNKSKNKIFHNYNKDLKRKYSYSRFTSIMSNWAENFTIASTWQLKHQLAFWKAKAKALEYENMILHNVIKKNATGVDPSPSAYKSREECETVEESSEEETIDQENGNDNNEDEFVVSDEYIQFLIENEKFRQDAKREREKFRASAVEKEKLAKEMETAMSRVKTKEEKEAEMKEMYGDKWERIQALETAMEAKFIDECDRDKPPYWPVIPLNFG